MSPQKSPQPDRFIHNRLPPETAWPEMLKLPGFDNDGPLNCVSFLLDRHLETNCAGRCAILSSDRQWSYDELAERVGRIAHLMVEDFNIEPGNRVLIRSANSAEVVAIWLAIQKIGAIAVTTMSLLRAAELATIIEIAQPSLAFCEENLNDELDKANKGIPVIHFSADGGELYRRIEGFPRRDETCPTLAGDISLVAFTSGTTGRPKAAIHFHRDIRAICETVSRHIIQPQPDDIFIGTAPLAFTFGLGGLLVFPLAAGATTVLNGRYSPSELSDAVGRYRASVCFTVPTFYQQMLLTGHASELSGLRLAVSSGEALPLQTREDWLAATGVALTEVIGATEMLHAFAGATGEAIRPGLIGPAIPGYELAILDDAGQPMPADEIGRLAVKGPTGCRYLDDPRQADYVQAGWNLTGDACSMTEDGYIGYHSRYDDMIISAGYNISGLEVENVLLRHEAVAECAVIGEADPERGEVVAAHVVVKAAFEPSADLASDLQDFVKQAIAPYKYPRRIHFEDQLPRNESGKIQRFRLRSS